METALKINVLNIFGDFLTSYVIFLSVVVSEELLSHGWRVMLG